MTVIVPFPPGAVSDLVPRAMTEVMAQQTGQPFIVDHKPGATQMLGIRAAAQAKPDGYTLLYGTATGLAINPGLKKDLPFDPVKDFEPISLTYSSPLFLVVRRELPVNSLADLIALAKREPGKLNYASGGAGSSSHLAAEFLKLITGISITHVPYGGTAVAVRDLLGGHVDMMFMASGMQYVGSGQLKVLGVTSTTRATAAPQVPTLAEAGAPGYAATTWFGFLAPAGTPKPIVSKLATEMRNAVTSGALQQKIKAGAEEMEFIGSTPEEFRAHIQKEIAQWRQVIDAAKIPRE